MTEMQRGTAAGGPEPDGPCENGSSASPDAGEPVPHCPRCRGALQQTEGGLLRRAVGVFLILAGLATCALLPLTGGDVELIPALAGIIVGLTLARRRLWWACVSCGSRYPRSLPPRGFVDDEDALGGAPGGKGTKPRMSARHGDNSRL